MSLTSKLSISRVTCVERHADAKLCLSCVGYTLPSSSAAAFLQCVLSVLIVIICNMFNMVTA